MRRIGIQGRPLGTSSLTMAQKVNEYASAFSQDREQFFQEEWSKFKAALEEFAHKHRADINKDPTLRHQFFLIAKTLGVDPLSSSKGYWADMFNMGSFYYDLAVQIIDVCISTRPLNGGLISMDDLLKRLKQLRGKKAASNPINEDDIACALKKIALLGPGYSIVTLRNESNKSIRYVSSSPEELSSDSTSILQAIDSSGFSTVSKLVNSVGWSEERVVAALNQLIKDGLCWIDNGPPTAQPSKSSVSYFFPSIKPIESFSQ